ncbi:MAG: gp58-like family protein [Clostridiales bacterium]|nr:gp58-like family protein [Clostridiales bacterium]
MAVFTNDSLPKYDKSDLPGTVKRLHDYAVALTEQLRFVLMNLDEDNVPELDVLRRELRDAAGNLSEVEQTAAGLTTRVENAEGGISSLTQTAAGLTTRVENAEGGISSLTQTAAGLSTRVENAEGGLSSLTQTADSLESRIESAEGGISSLNQTASSLSSTVSGLDGKYTSLKQTVDSIDLTGMVTFSDLETEGESVINGANITTGDLNVATDGVGGMYFYNGKVKSENEIGRIEVYSSRYPDLFIETANENNIRLVSDAHISMESGANCHIYIEGDDYVQIRAGGVNYYFRSDGIYRGSTQIA